MKVSGFTIVRNAIKYGYPVEESIRSLLPLVDELVVGAELAQAPSTAYDIARYERARLANMRRRTGTSAST